MRTFRPARHPDRTRRLDHHHRRQVQWQETELAERRGRRGRRFDLVLRPSLRYRRLLRGHQGRPEQEKKNVYRVDPKSGDIKMVVDDFVQPNGLCFSPDEKKLYICDTGFTDGPDNPSHIRVFDVISGPESFRTARSLRTCPSPALPTGCAATPPGAFGARWVGAIRMRMACAATLLTATSSARSHSGNRRQFVLRRPAAKQALYRGSSSLYAVYTSAQGAMKPDLLSGEWGVANGE